MAFDAETLKQLGVDENIISDVISAHKADISGSYIPKSRFDEVNGELKDAKSGISQRDEQIEELKAFKGDNTALKAKVEELQKSNEESVRQYASQLDTIRKQNAVNALITDAQDASLVMSQIDLDKVIIDEDGTVTGAKDQIDALRESKGFLFKQSEPTDVSSSVRGSGRPPEGGVFGATNVSSTQEAYGKRLAETQNLSMGATQSATEYYFGKA